MERGYEYVRDHVVNFKLDWCCWLAPIRIGLLLTGYFNIIIAVVSLVGIADESFAPIVVQVQDSIMEDNATKPVPMLAYSAELAFNSILLAAVYRNDLTLLRVYMKYCIAAIVASIMFYSMVVAAIGIFMAITLVMSILFQIYVLILVRSLIVEIKLSRKKLETPTLVMSTLIAEAQEKEKKESEADVEAPAPAQDAEEKRPETRLETVDEHPKEETKDNDKE